jgi:hypothetical protein
MSRFIEIIEISQPIIELVLVPIGVGAYRMFKASRDASKKVLTDLQEKQLALTKAQEESHKESLEQLDQAAYAIENIINLSEQLKETARNNEAMCVTLLRADIYAEMEKLSAQLEEPGHLSIESYAHLREMIECYKKAGGNTDVKHLFATLEYNISQKYPGILDQVEKYIEATHEDNSIFNFTK